MQIDNIRKGIERKISLKEKERDTEITNLNTIKSAKIDAIANAILANKKEADIRILELKKLTNKQSIEEIKKLLEKKKKLKQQKKNQKKQQLKLTKNNYKNINPCKITDL